MARRGWYEFSEYTKELSRKRAGYCCERCGRNGRTEIHHKIPVKIAKELNIPHLMISSLINCEALCSNCHAEADRELHDWSTYAISILGAFQAKLL